MYTAGAAASAVEGAVDRKVVSDFGVSLHRSKCAERAHSFNHIGVATHTVAPHSRRETAVMRDDGGLWCKKTSML